MQEPPTCTPKNDVLIGVPGCDGGEGPRGGLSPTHTGGSVRHVHCARQDRPDRVGSQDRQDEEDSDSGAHTGTLNRTDGDGDDRCVRRVSGHEGMRGESGGWMAAAAVEFAAGLSARAETPAAAIFASLLSGHRNDLS